MTEVIKENVKEKVRELRREGKRQGEHFIVRRGILFMYDIPKSKMQKASELHWEGVPVEEVARIIEVDEESLKRWYAL